MAVTTTKGLPGRHHCVSSTHLTSKHTPQASPFLNRVVLNVAVASPYPFAYKFSYPQVVATTKQGKKDDNNEGLDHFTPEIVLMFIFQRHSDVRIITKTWFNSLVCLL